MTNTICGFQGNHDEVFQHALQFHNTIGTFHCERADGAQWIDSDEGGYTKTEKTITNDKGEVLFVCCEEKGSFHEWEVVKENRGGITRPSLTLRSSVDGREEFETIFENLTEKDLNNQFIQQAIEKQKLRKRVKPENTEAITNVYQGEVKPDYAVVLEQQKQYFSELPDDSRLDEIEETARIGAN